MTCLCICIKVCIQVCICTPKLQNKCILILQFGCFLSTYYKKLYTFNLTCTVKALLTIRRRCVRCLNIFILLHFRFAPSSVKGEYINTTWLYDALAEKWDHYLTEDAKVNLKDRGEFSLLVRPGLRVISLNNNVAFTSNW